jgi:hypothetical protein
MTHNLSLGAFNKHTGEYVYPRIANKKDEYVCPDCGKDLILCKGEVRIPYFRHTVDSVNPCHHYSSPNEAQIHKDAKLLLKRLIEERKVKGFNRPCCSCDEVTEFDIPEFGDKTKIEMEFKFNYNGLKFADVAYISDLELLYIFEICNKHKTRSKDRPEPWFEIDAETLIHMANDEDLNCPLQIPCIRFEKCYDCHKQDCVDCAYCGGTGETDEIDVVWHSSYGEFRYENCGYCRHYCCRKYKCDECTCICKLCGHPHDDCYCGVPDDFWTGDEDGDRDDRENNGE